MVRWAALSVVFFACGGAEGLELSSKLEQDARIEVLAPRVDASGDCGAALPLRHCAEDYERLSTITVPALSDRVIRLDDSGACPPALWLRLVALGDVGPVNDPGTLFRLPARVELEYGAGALHSQAFPQGIVRLDEVGAADTAQSSPPARCR